MVSSNYPNPINGQRFVACGNQIPSNNYIKINTEELNNIPCFQNYLKGNPSKVSFVILCLQNYE